jgi:putative membrane protein
MAQFGSASALGAEGPRFKSGYPDVDEQQPDPRFLLANERTLLAWLRTALAFVVAGLAALSLGNRAHHARLLSVLGALVCLVGAIAAVTAYRRWQRITAALESGERLPPLAGAAPLVGMLVLCAVVAIVVMLVDAF